MSKSFNSFAIVPAAGRSVRMGQPKLLLPWRDSTIIQCTLAAWKASSVDQIAVVVHPDDLRLAEVCREAGAHVVIASLPPPEMKTSIALGLQFVAKHFNPAPNDVWLVAPGDMPELNPAVINRVLGCHRPDSAMIVVPIHSQKRGHPVLFPWPLAAEVSRLATAEGVDSLLASHRVMECNCPEGQAGDIDTPNDYRVRHDRHD